MNSTIQYTTLRIYRVAHGWDTHPWTHTTHTGTDKPTFDPSMPFLTSFGKTLNRKSGTIFSIQVDQLDINLLVIRPCIQCTEPCQSLRGGSRILKRGGGHRRSTSKKGEVQEGVQFWALLVLSDTSQPRTTFPEMEPPFRNYLFAIST